MVLDELQCGLEAVLGQQRALTREEARAVCESLLRTGMEGRETRVAALLGGMASRGETAAELAGFADAMRAAAVPLSLEPGERERLVDSCGTGGDGAGTFNISTGAALVAAAAGAWVAKHGNRAVTSKCGSADVLEALGVRVDLGPAEIAESLRRHGFAFLAAQQLQPAMRAVAGIRRELGVRTIFNLLGPLTNPAGARAQAVGVYAERLVPVVTEALALLGTRHALVLHGTGMDELSTCGTTHVGEARESRVTFYRLTPEELGVERVTVSALVGGEGASENAELLLGIFAGEKGARRDVVVVNAAAVLVAAGVSQTLEDGVRRAAATIDSGKVETLLSRLRNG